MELRACVNAVTQPPQKVGTSRTTASQVSGRWPEAWLRVSKSSDKVYNSNAQDTAEPLQLQGERGWPRPREQPILATCFYLEAELNNEPRKSSIRARWSNQRVVSAIWFLDEPPVALPRNDIH